MDRVGIGCRRTRNAELSFKGTHAPWRLQAALNITGLAVGLATAVAVAWHSDEKNLLPGVAPTEAMVATAVRCFWWQMTA